MLAARTDHISPALFIHESHSLMLSHITYTYIILSLSLSLSTHMAMLMEVEDDVFFADLNRQISLLITDDDNEDGDELYYSPPISSYYPTSVSIQSISRTSSMFPTTQTQYHFDHFDQLNYKTSTASTDLSKGTGVFIPKSSQWNNRSRRSSKHQQQTTSRTNNYYNNYNSYNNNTNNFRHYHQQQQLPSQTQVIIGPKKC